MYGCEPALEKCSCICFFLLTLNAATGIWPRWSRGRLHSLKRMAQRDWKSLDDCSAERKKKKTFNERGRKLAGEEERVACLRDQSRTPLDTWELWPMPSCRLIWAMNYETNKSVAEGVSESRPLHIGE